MKSSERKKSQQCRKRKAMTKLRKMFFYLRMCQTTDKKEEENQ
jgi:hypothetical protein